MSKTFKTLPKQPGIRKNTLSGTYQAIKKIKGKQYTATFDTVREAQYWRATFNGVEEKKLTEEIPKTTSTLRHVWERMKALHFPSVELSTQRIWERRFKFWDEIAHMHIEDITPAVISQIIEKRKAFYMSEEYKARGSGCSGRCTMNNELNIFNTVFNWYKEEEEFLVESQNRVTPIRKRHREAGYIREGSVKPEVKKITPEQAFKFFAHMQSSVYKDLAVMQYFCAARIGEVAGIQISNIYLEQDLLMIREVVSWCNASKMFEYLKPYPKNQEPRAVFIHGVLREIIERRLKMRKPGCDFLFHVDGKPLNFCNIQVHYRRAQREAGIPQRGTHCLRHGMATLARKVGGSLDAVMAMTGHKDIKLADHYSKIDDQVQKDTSLKVVEHIRSLGLFGESMRSQLKDDVESSETIVPLRLVK